MSVTITDLRTTASEADATTGWTSTTGGTITLFTTDPAPVESTGCLGLIVSNETEGVYFTMGAGVDMSAGMLVYCWALARGAMDTRANGGLAIILGDGTNRIAFHVGGSDVAGFRHSDGPADWQCLTLDTIQLPTQTTVIAGTLAALNLASITQIGVNFRTLAKSVGGVSNCWVDAIRYGNDGLRVTGGTSGDRGTFEQIAAADRDTASGTAYGICRKLAEGVYGLQGPLVFGDTAGTSAHYFSDTNAIVVFEDRGFHRNKYKITVVGNSTGVGSFRLGTSTGSGDTESGINGCQIIAPLGVDAEFIANDADLDELLLHGSSLVGFTLGVTLSADATNGPNHRVTGCTLRNCGEVDPGRVVFRNTLITGTKAFRRTLDSARQDDGGSFTNYTTAANNDTTADVNLTPAAPAINDAFYFGHIARFNEIETLVSTAENATGVFAWEYWNGSTWSALTMASDSHNQFTRVGRRITKFTIPANWTTTTVNSAGPFYYVRCRVTTAGSQAVASRIMLFGPPDKSALLWNANADVEYCSFTQNTDADNDPHGIEHTADAATVTYTGLTFSGNDYDIEYSSGTANDMTVNAADGSDPTTFEATEGTTGDVVINNAVNLTISVEDEAGSPIQNAQVAIYAGATELMNEDTTVAGEATQSYNYLGDVDIVYRVRKTSSGTTRYYPFEGAGTITALGFSATVRLTVDTTAAA